MKNVAITAILEISHGDALTATNTTANYYGKTRMTSLSTFASPKLTSDVIANQQHIGVLQVSGVDSKKFLQGQVTCDMNKLSESHSIYGAVCNVKGRIIANFFIVQKDDLVLLLLPTDLIDKTLAHFKKYAVFFKTELTDATESYQIASACSMKETLQEAPNALEETLPTQRSTEGIQITLSSYPVNIRWTISHRDERIDNDLSPSQNENTTLVNALTVLAARPLVKAEQSEETLPQWLNMQRTGGISFTKGCYTGQEIVARMQYRGKSKKQLALITWQGELDMTQAMVNEQGKTIGQIFQVAATEDTFVAQAILNIEPNDADALLLDGQPLTLLPLPYSLGDQQ